MMITPPPNAPSSGLRLAATAKYTWNAALATNHSTAVRSAPGSACRHPTRRLGA